MTSPAVVGETVVDVDEPVAPRPVVQSVDRCLELMELLGRNGWTGVTDLARELGIHKSTVFRLLATLEGRGMVEQDAASQKYRLGFGIVRLAGAVRSTRDLTRWARPVCERLSRAVDETVNLAVLEGYEVVNIDQTDLSTSVITTNWVGRHSTLHTTSSGKVLLAHLPERSRRDVLRGPLERFTDQTVTDPGRLRAELAAIRQTGYALALEELEPGLHAIAAPIHTLDGAVVAAVAVSGPAYRLTLERLESGVADLTCRAAQEISERLGHRPD